MIALDGSASVTFQEFGAVTGGLAMALRDPEVMAALQSGPRRSSYVSLLLWSGPGAQVEDVPRIVVAGETAIGDALVAAKGLLDTLPSTVTQQVIDVAGDGRSNAGRAPGPVRDRLVASGVTINGLCVLHEEADLVQNYTAEVIGGPNAFAVACQDFDGFANAMRRKLVKELS